MIAFEQVLCPVDFSDTSARALAYATALAKWYEAQLTVLHVVPAFDAVIEPAVGFGETGRLLYRPSREQIIAELRLSVGQAQASALDPVLLAEVGCVHEVIVSHAASLPADLLVMGTHGRGGFNRLFLGSVTEKVLRTATIPVLAVPPPTLAPGPVAFKKILCPIDFSPSSLKALQYALDLGRQAGGCVTVLHALEYLDEQEPCEHVDVHIRSARRRLIDHARERLHAVVAGEPQAWCEIEEAIVIKRAYRAILQQAAASGAELIVMGAQGDQGVELMLYGSNTQHVVRRAACPVLTVRG